MAIECLDETTFATHVTEHLGGAIDSDAVIAECLRAELAARPGSRGADVRRWASECLQQTDPEALRLFERVWSQLEQTREVLSIPHGGAHPGPLRLVQLPNGRARVLCGAPRATIAVVLGTTVEIDGVRRMVADDEPTRAAATRAGGVVVTLDAWAGFDRAMPADEAFLAALEAELLDPFGECIRRDVQGPWQGFDPGTLGHAGRGPSWHVGASAARLWRAWPTPGQPTYAFTPRGANPESGHARSLGPQKALRAAYALLDAAHEGYVVPFERAVDAPGVVHAELPLRLPAAEYRWLSEVGVSASQPGGGSIWSIPEPLVGAFESMLFRRLGLVTQDKK